MSELRGVIGIVAAFFAMLSLGSLRDLLTVQELGGPVVQLEEEGWFDLEELGKVALGRGELPPRWRSQPFQDGDRVRLFGGWILGSSTEGYKEEAAAEPTPYRALGRKVPVNRASQAELEALPGIGPTLARRIIDGRPYRNIAALDRVKGIGPKTLEKLGSYFEFSP